MDSFETLKYTAAIGAWLLLGLRFAYRYFNFHLHQKSTLPEMFDMAIGAFFIVAIWPAMMISKLLRED